MKAMIIQHHAATFISMMAIYFSVLNPTQAEKVVLPAEFTDHDAPGAGTPYPFDPFFFGEEGLRVQQLFEGTSFPEHEEGVLIQSVGFRLSGSPTERQNSFDVVFPKVEVHLSTSPKSMANMSNRFANNVGVDESIVYDAPLRWQAEFVRGPVQSMSLIIPFDEPFRYLPSQGSLLLDIRVKGQKKAGLVDWASFSGWSIVRGHLTTAEVGEFVLGSGLITQFSFQAIPEPATVGLASLGLLMVIATLSRGESGSDLMECKR